MFLQIPSGMLHRYTCIWGRCISFLVVCDWSKIVQFMENFVIFRIFLIFNALVIGKALNWKEGWLCDSLLLIETDRRIELGKVFFVVNEVFYNFCLSVSRMRNINVDPF